ncbi:hypothetical protein ACFO4O_12980 [Glaciecola siphonariae]|uniref:Roadblock/LAMTOR2 domain-containing protein n=1 Tax=Glaciecola siphonariae TaxID=521012 RepID=A0ABV9LZK5_9ALTE
MEPNNSGDGKLRLAASEQAEIAKIKADPTTVGYAVVTKRGDELESQDLWEDTAPIMSNLSDIADQIGENLGEESPCRLIVSESVDFELTSVFMESAHVIALKRKTRSAIGGTRNAG